LSFRITNDRESNSTVHTEIEREGSTFLSLRHLNAGATGEDEIMLDHEGGGTFELTFTGGPAAFEFEIALELQDDAGSGGDAGDDFDTGVEIASGQEVVGSVGGGDGVDVYLLELPEGGPLLTVDFEVPRDASTNMHFEVNLEGSAIDSQRHNSPASSGTLSELFTAEDGGTLEIVVTAASGGAARSDYLFTATLDDQADAGGAGDAGDGRGDAREIDTGEELTALMGGRDSADWYTFSAPGAAVTITLESDIENEGNMHFRVEDDSGSNVAESRHISPGSTEVLEFEAEAGAEYRIEANPAGGAVITYTWTID
jgi:hypothetical protein